MILIELFMDCKLIFICLVFMKTYTKNEHQFIKTMGNPSKSGKIFRLQGLNESAIGSLTTQNRKIMHSF